MTQPDVPAAPPGAAVKPPPTYASFAEVQREEWRRIGGEPKVGLAISGGGIRSATFALGLLQAINGLGLFGQIDYVSTVSGGGYTGGWLYALLRRGQLDAALHQNGTEPAQVRFLRAYSNYLTPKLGLFSGDTWAAFATVARNLSITLSILSLSLMAVLFLPWAIHLAFVSATTAPAAWLPTAAAACLVLAFSVSASNMSRPLTDDTWENDARDWTPSWAVQVLVVGPLLVASGLLAVSIATLRPVDHAFRWSIEARYVGLWSLSLALAQLVKVALSSYRAYEKRSKVQPLAAAGAPPSRLGQVWAWIAAAIRRAPGAAQRQRTNWAGAARAWIKLSLAAIPAAAAGVYVVRAVDASWIPPGREELRMPLVVLGLMVALTVQVGLSGRMFSEETREWWARVGGLVVLGTLLLVVLDVLVIHVPQLFDTAVAWLGHDNTDWVKRALGVAWAVITGTGIMAGRSTDTSNGRGHRALELVGRIAPFVFVVGYLVILAILLARWLSPGDGSMAAQEALAWMTGLGFLAWLLSWFADLNEFSLHALYRNRLVRCYLGATNDDRKAHPFHGFDPRDDLPLHPTAHERITTIRPYPIFNTAINLVGGENLAWQQRKAASFIFTPDASGYGYRNDEQRDHGGVAGDRQVRPKAEFMAAYARTGAHGGDGVSIGLAMATSGAAASPNMGYHSSPTLAFLMTVFNVRLGWWMRNPRYPSSWTEKRKRLSLLEFVRELLGLTTAERDFVYLSDGGHFENLGVYELVRRRCPFVIVSDAGQDGAMSFEDLGNAIEKCRADFGIPIEIDVAGIRTDRGRSATHCAVGTIHYECADHTAAAGTIVYIKSSLTGDEPSDVLRYASLNPEFPHQSTGDQFFSESQFESYRELGHHVGMRVFGVAKPGTRPVTASETFRLLRQRWTPPAPLPHDGIAKYSNALNTIWTTVRTNDSLRFLDRQVFPEWASLMAAGGGVGRAGRLPLPPPRSGDAPAPEASTYWLPRSEDDRRAGFYVCNQMLQLMEDVYIEFRLDDHHDHIDNRGWMNLFQHWAWSGMVCATWAVTAGTYDPRFQRFCAERLDLGTGRVVVPHTKRVVLPSRAMWLGDQATHDRTVAALEAVGLNFWEIELVSNYLVDARERSRAVVLVLHPIRVRVESPRRADRQEFEFTAGYMLLDGIYGQKPVRLVHMRVQNHLRKMGVAGAALRSLLAAPADLGEEWGLDRLEVEVPTVPEAESDGEPAPTSVALAEAYPTADAAKQIRGWIRAFTRP